MCGEAFTEVCKSKSKKEGKERLMIIYLDVELTVT
jgi:hypothetical protein